ncbi:non-ribosomal peptide synthetase [Paenibacillus sp. BIHB 4019]|uniref:Non-ribosomal peptide synthetase n=1 Tax=Paenibacillus sp. BIHB 4019 TaxID=1870819 RepID=A0A1B2DNV9_9BACL|nr:non-ribosomal peptide synthetase [Paenibacillus sp. BIHB 4019]ANY69398.1 non-ribosomal peptide synthetase [Paenibacillus sp. BIHB 4019]
MKRFYYPLTHAQKRIWYTEQFYPGTSMANLSGFLKLRSHEGMDNTRLINVIQQVVRSNDALRLRIAGSGSSGEEPKQYIAEYAPFELETADFSEAGDMEAIMAWGQAEARTPMPLYDSPLFYFRLFKISSREIWLFSKIHHIISDGISNVLMGNQIIDGYLELVLDSGKLLPQQISYADYIESELEYEQSDRFQKDKNYWNMQFKALPESTSLKQCDINRIRTEAARFSQVLPQPLQHKLQHFCKDNSVSMLSLFLSLLYIYMYRITGEQEAVLGTFMGNRTSKKEKQMLGMFVSTIPMRAYVDESQDFLRFVQQRMKDQLTLIRHQKYPYNVLVNDLRELHGQAGRLFGLSLEYQVMNWEQKEGLSFIIEPLFSEHEVNDISIHVKERWDTSQITIDMDYRTELFAKEEVDHIYNGILVLLEDALNDPAKAIGELEICTLEEKRKLLAQAGNVHLNVPNDQMLHGLFEQQAAILPWQTAVVDEEGELTYKELNERSNRLGRILKAKGVGPDTPVAICMGRSKQIITAIMGVLKAGGAYVPMDPDFPQERIQFMLQDSGAKMLLTEPNLLESLTVPDAIDVLVLDKATLLYGECSNLDEPVSSHHLAYIIYTSGTTGNPKGVMIEHLQVAHLITALHSSVYEQYGPGLKLSLVAPFHFDASVQQIFAALLLGHTLHIIPKASLTSGQALADYYRSKQIDVADGTPAHLQMLLAAKQLDGIKLAHMLIGGEALPHATIREFAKHFKASGAAARLPTITNVYGPTECCVDASALHIARPDMELELDSAYLSIGRALGNNRLYIFDANGRMQPAGAAGELYIGGAGVGRGYLNLPELTAETFIDNPYVPGERLFKTGDLARWKPNGMLEFLGRQDDQVKIRGYRIELGEIAAALQKHEKISRAVVLLRSEELCAYVVLNAAEETLSIAELREFLSKQLPMYMIPSYFAQLDQIPLTSSGKVDRKKLLLQVVMSISDSDYASPALELEVQLAQIWQAVLGVERIGLYDSFFELGGHSLKAMEMLARAHQKFGAAIPLQVLFESPTVYALAQYIGEAERSTYTAIECAESNETYPLSFAQQRVYIVSQLESAGIGYNMPAAVLLEGDIDIPRLKDAFGQLVQRHEALRTSFSVLQGVPVQTIHASAPFVITVKKSGGQSAQAALSAFVRPFDLGVAPLIRAELQPLSKDEHLLLFDMHHLISDGVSIGIILKELSQLYAGEKLPELRLQYKDYAVWQAKQAETGYLKEEKYWLDKLSGELPVLQLLTDYPRPAVQSFEGDRVSAMLDRRLKDKLNKLAEESGATLYMVLLAAYYAALAKYTGQEELVIGTPVAGRNHAELDGIVGMFIQTLAIRTEINRQGSFGELLQQVRSNVLDAFEHQDYPFERLVGKLHLPRDMSRNPLFDTIFILQNAYEGLPVLGNLRMSIQETNVHVAKFDLTLQAKEELDSITLDMDYSIKLYGRTTINQLLTHYVKLLEEIANQPSLKLGAVDILLMEEKEQLVAGFNPRATVYPKESTLVELFEQQVNRTPDRTALVFGKTELTYQELNSRVNQLARTLYSRGVRPGKVAAVWTHRSAEMVIGILAILKAGGAYVPIDPEHPQERMKYLLADSEAVLLLTEHALLSEVENLDFAGGCIAADNANLYEGDASNLDIPISSGMLANLTYTSGTTGTPKGNMVTHANIIRTVINTNYLSISAQDVFLSLSNYVFDAFMFDMFGSLLHGSKLVLASKDTILDISRLPQVIEQERISVLMITTALFNLLVDIHPASICGIRKVLFGGERASVEHVRKAVQAAGPGKLLHMYGPSESTVFTTYYEVDAVADEAAAIPIGRPVSNTSVYIVDAFNQLQPIGAAGELCVGGDGLVLGYANRPELTAEKFVPHLFADAGRLYRTGDLARWLPDGNIEFIGRIDQQIKIRGQRIELGEIEHQLRRAEAIREAIVLAVDTAVGDKLLCAYVVTDLPISNSELGELAAKELPAYMVPSVFIQLDELPLTGNGKVDRRALPVPDLGAISSVNYEAARNETEKQLVTIWQEVLGIEPIGVQHNFFELGGHSLKAMALLAHIHQVMKVELPLRVLFQAPTIASLAVVVSQTVLQAGEQHYAAITAAGTQEVYPASSAQRRLYVLQQLEGAEQSYNMPTVLKLKGLLDKEQLETAIRSLVQRHEALRTSFEITDSGKPVQRIHEEVDFSIVFHEADEAAAIATSAVDAASKAADADIQQIIKAFIRPFSLNTAPLVRAMLVKLSEEEHLLLFDMHHIISDGMSVGLLLEDLTQLYAGKQLEPLRIQYKDYAVWQQSFLQTEAYGKQESYWLEQFAEEPPVLEWPTDCSRPSIQSFEGEQVAFHLNPELTEALHRLGQAAGTTLHMTLLAAYSLFLSKLSGQEDIVVGSPIAGRAHADLSSLVGMFINTLAVRSFPNGDKSFAAYLQEVRQMALGALENQDYPFEELVAKVKLQRDMSRNPLFDAMFDLQMLETQHLSLEGMRLELYPFEDKTAKFDLTLSAVEQEDGIIECRFIYNTALFKQETIKRWSVYFTELVRHITAESGILLKDASMLPEAERERLLVEFNDTAVHYPQHYTVQQLFELQVLRTPSQHAVIFNGRKWTYLELNARANRLARVLIAKGIGADKPVGIMSKPSLEMAAGVLAILKAGGAFVPIDPEYPEERIAYMLADSGAAILLTQTTSSVPAIFNGEVILLDGECGCWADTTDLSEEANPQTATGPNHLAYIIYTSGTTGQPKGVMIEHQSLVNLCYWHNEAFFVTDLDRSAKYAGFGFDASVWEMFPYWLAGAQVHVIDEALRLDMMQLNAYFEQNHISITFLPTQICEQFMELDNRSLRVLLTGGDKLKRLAPHAYTLVNNYGPTENTVVATSIAIPPMAQALPIGMPIDNTRIYILGPDQQLQPIGTFGEIWIAGSGLARGYMNRPEETEQRFVPDPFQPGERMYRTGDSGRWQADGSIEYGGRIDQQVKVRGYRIEISEIEAHLLRNPHVQAAAVVAVQDAQGDTALCGYVVPINDSQLDSEQWRADLAQSIPAYMVPKYWVNMDRLPLTPNGKVDRKSLPQPVLDNGAADYKAPRNAQEELLVQVWQEVLGASSIGISDNFFSLGGDSIRSIQMANRLYKHGWKLEMKDLFQHPTIEQVSSYLQVIAGGQVDQGAVEGEVALTPVQKWFFERDFTDKHHWNQSVMLHAASGLDPQFTEQALGAIMEHHDALRIVFTQEGNEAIAQHNGKPADCAVKLEVIRPGAVAAEELEQAILLETERIHASIDLHNGPLLKAAIFQTSQGDHLLLVIHHLVVDGVSWRILLEDFAIGYLQASKGETIVLADKTHSYQEWASQLQLYANSKALLKEKEYWKQLESIAVNPLPKDHAATDQRMRHTRTTAFSLSENETKQLTTSVHLTYRTEMNDILLTALGLAVKEWSEHNQILLNMEGHGREEIVEAINVSRTVGWFTSQYPVVLDMSYTDDIAYQIKRVKEDLRHIPHKGIGYGLLRYLAADGHKAGLAFSSKPEISFNYLGQFDEMTESGLFGRSPLSPGNPLSPNTERVTAIDVIGFIEGDVLSVTIAYNGLEFEEQTMVSFSERIQAALLRLIEHCISQKGGELTPSDLGDDELTLEELDNLLQMI